ncbi:hypothetical protein FACS1894159_08730 [Bacteroidia bacterium]|nr:hypothetical protein FACS1894159_08730 [Bacteroidia bacterium]
MKRTVYSLLLGAFVAVLNGCMDKEPTPPNFVHVESVGFQAAAVTVEQTQTLQLEVTFVPENAGNKGYIWHNNTDPAVASVNSDGLVKGLQLGKTTISIQTNDMRRIAYVEVTVVPYVVPNPIQSITLDNSSHAFTVLDAPFTVTATVLPADATIPDLEWESADEYIATVSPTGEITPVGYGKCNIYARAVDGSNKFAVCVVSVDGVKDRNYDVAGGINAANYYKKTYKAVNITVKNDNGDDVVQTWLDRNLGAGSVATSLTDYQAYGSLFQWSRKADGHEQVSWTTSTAGMLVNGITTAGDKSSSRLDAGHSKFIPVTASPYDWASDPSSANNGLWGGVLLSASHMPLDDETNANNPCPVGYRVPTAKEFEAMGRAITGVSGLTVGGVTNVLPSGGINTYFNSPLKLVASGYVANNTSTGATEQGGDRGIYWASTPQDAASNSYRFMFFSTYLGVSNWYRAFGYAIRCIRDTPLDTDDLTL